MGPYQIAGLSRAASKEEKNVTTSEAGEFVGGVADGLAFLKLCDWGSIDRGCNGSNEGSEEFHPGSKCVAE